MMRKSVVADNRIELMIDHSIYTKLKQKIEDHQKNLRNRLGKLHHKYVQTEKNRRKSDANDDGDNRHSDDDIGHSDDNMFDNVIHA